MNEREIFIEALQKSSAAEQDRFLSEACGGDALLKRRVEELLREAKKLGGFLEPQAELDDSQFASTIVAPQTERLGDKIGPYKLLQVIGEGGMGVVYMAEQHDPVSRRVALKIIKPGMDTRQVIVRFEAERQALAMMDHPSIAKVLDAGATASGRPYFVMELVKGLPITEYCDKQHLTPHQRLELFLPVCQAVQHAHQKGIIHRDLKPSNVLVALYDGRPVPKVIDFGVAKATNQRLTEKTMFTEFGQVVGTLEYMSPEQAELSQLDIDTRSDIYSLGVMLYELLTGTTPFEKKRLQSAAFMEILRMIREEEPPRPSTRLSTTDQLPSIAANRGMLPQKLSGLLRGELDWLVMKTLEKDRSRRYETANGLANDIERYLHNEPVLACPPSATYRLRKFLQRNRRLTMAAALILLAVMAGIAGTTAGLMQAAWERSAKNEARENADRSDKLARAAEQAEQVAIAAEAEAKGLLIRAQSAEREVQVGAHLSRARLHRISGSPGQRLQCLEEIAAATALNPAPEIQRELRNEAIAAMLLTDVRLAQSVDGLSVSDRPIFDQNFKRYALTAADGTIIVRTTDGSREVARMPPPQAPLETVSFSDDDRYLICNQLKPREAILWDLEARRESFRVPGGLRETKGRRRYWSWISLETGEIRVFDANGREESRFNVGRGWHGFASDPEGRQLAVGQPGALQIWDLATGKLIREIPGMANAGMISWDPRGRFIAAFRQGSELYIWDVAHHKLQAKTTSIDTPGGMVDFHPSGELIVTDGWDKTLRLWNPWTGEQVLTISGASDFGEGFSADGRLLGMTRSGAQLQLWEIVTSATYRRALAIPPGEPVSDNLRFDPSGRLLITGAVSRLWDVWGARNLGTLMIGGAAFDRRDGLLGSGDGLWHLPVTFRPASNAPSAAPSERLTIGPMRRINGQRTWKVEVTRDGTHALLIGVNGHEHVVLDLARPNQPGVVLDAPSVATFAIDPLGRWVAVGPSRSENPARSVDVFDLTTGKMQCTLPAVPSTGTIGVKFSGDGNWLGTGVPTEYQLWKTGTWEPGPIIRRERSGVWPGNQSFSGDGSLWAISRARQTVNVLRTSSAEELFQIDLRSANDHGQEVILAFSDDGTQLAVISKLQSLDILNLRSIRAELVRLGLDWDLPAYPPAPANLPDITSVTINSQNSRPLPKSATTEELIDYWTAMLDENRFDAVAYQNRSVLLESSGKYAEALADCQAGLQLQPKRPDLLGGRSWNHARLGHRQESVAAAKDLLALQPGLYSNYEIGAACNNLGWSNVIGPESIREPELAVQLGQRAVELDPQRRDYRNTLGVAFYRAQRWDAAARELEISLKDSANNGIAYRNLFFLAAVEHRRGNAAKSREYLNQGREWCADHEAALPKEARELARKFREEAEAVLEQPATEPNAF